MASSIKETLEYMNRARKNAIKNARIAGLTVSDNASPYEISTLFLNQNNDSSLSQVEPWVRPSDWWDCDTIISNAEDRVVDGVTYYPAYIVLLDDDDDTTTFTKTGSYKRLDYSGILTSDGSWYTDDNAVHTWDKTQDKACSLGYKTRYFIVYITSKSQSGWWVSLASFPCLEVVVRQFPTHSSSGSFAFGSNNSFPTSSYPTNPKLLHFKELSTCPFPKMARYAFSYCPNIRSVEFLQSVAPTDVFTIEEYALMSTYSLRNLQLPDCLYNLGSSAFSDINFNVLNTNFNVNKVTRAYYSFDGAIGLPQDVVFTSATNAFSQGRINDANVKSITFPTQITTEASSSRYIFDYSSGERFFLPNLETAYNPIANNCMSLRVLDLQSLTTINFTSNSNAILAHQCPALTTINIPRLENVSVSNNAPLVYNCISLKEFTFPSTLASISAQALNFSNNNRSLNTVNLPNDWAFTGLNVNNCPMKKSSLLDILDKLADVTEESDTHTITFGATNLAKLTAEEIAIGTNKGWTIS